MAESAQGRWYGFFLQSDGAGNASIEGGVFENDYVQRSGAGRSARCTSIRSMPARMRPAGPTGRARICRIVPYHFTADESGIPIPPPVGAAPQSKASLARLEQRIAVMNDEGLVRNLQAAYGYYVNRRMWDDVTDLFAADGVYEVGGVGVYVGASGRAQGA